MAVCCLYSVLAILSPQVLCDPVDQSQPLQQAGKSPVKVFILAGQSNMEGYGALHGVDKSGGQRKGTLTYLLNDPVKGTLFKHLRDDRPMLASGTIPIEATNGNFGDPAPNRFKKLRVEYTLDGSKQQQTVDEGETLTLTAKPGQVTIEKAIYGDLPDGDKRDVTEEVKSLIKADCDRVRWKVREDVWVWFNGRKGGLSAGFGASKDLFGPELQFGNVLGDTFDNQILIIKTAWGGKSLYKEFRPPSSGGEVGPCYGQMIETIKRVLTNLKIEFPGYDEGGYELSGLVWWHGWNDGCDPKNAVPEYEQNLVNLIKDLRKDLQVPKLPVVIGELTGPWVEVGGEWGRLRKAQADAAAHSGFQGNVLFVPTHDFVRKEEDSPGGWPAHEFNNAETYFLVGDALGKAMMKLLTVPQASKISATWKNSPRLKSVSLRIYDTISTDRLSPLSGSFMVWIDDNPAVAIQFLPSGDPSGPVAFCDRIPRSSGRWPSR